MDERHSAAEILTGELDREGIAKLLEQSEHDATASAELDLVCDLQAAAASERATLLASLNPPRPQLALRAAGLVGLAAALLFGWLGLRGGTAPATLVAATELPPPPYLALELRAAATDLSARFRASMEAYARADWEAAERELSNFLTRTPEHAAALFYRGSVRQALGRADAAADDYRAAATRLAGPVSEHALWRLAHLQLSGGERERARQILAELLELNGSFAPNARALLAELDR